MLKYKVIHTGRPFREVDGHTYLDAGVPVYPFGRLLRTEPGQRYAVSFTAGAALYRTAVGAARHSYGTVVAFVGEDLI